MAKKKGKTKGKSQSPFHWLRGTGSLRPGAARTIAEAAEANGGWLDLDDPAVFTRTKVILSDLKLAMMILSNPKHPENGWACLAIQVSLGGRNYLYLLPCIPEWIKTAWETDGEPPPLGASWLGESVIEDGPPQTINQQRRKVRPKKLSKAEQMSRAWLKKFDRPKKRRDL